MGHTFHLCCIEKRMWLNEWLDWMQHLLISQKCQPPSSPYFPPPPYKMNDVKSMMPLPGAVWMTDLNKIGKAPLGNKKLAFIQQQAVSLPASFFPTCPAQLSERSVKDGRLQQGGGGWDKDQRDSSSVNWVWHGLFYFGYTKRSCGEAAALPLSIHEVSALLKTTDLLHWMYSLMES